MEEEKTEEIKEIASPAKDEGRASYQSAPAAAVAAESGAAIKATGEKDTGVPAGKAEKKSPGWLATWLAVAAVCLLISMAVSAGSVYVYDHYFAQKIVSVDIKGYIANQRDLYLSGKETGKEFRANIDKLAAAVKGIPQNRVAIMGDAVIRNAEIEKLP